MQHSLSSSDRDFLHAFVINSFIIFLRYVIVLFYHSYLLIEKLPRLNNISFSLLYKFLFSLIVLCVIFCHI
ncbi:hypothetical protein GLOIN_2v1575812 [Rhizophagus irregularis DAOM 181602=DAOM 197198]|uniref:Uncharacterized protein n=1 Tax=Rhizophagus irregularis (strain DAOM 181602 / DAOM 197198 / MUCL 43194) TaxID=747089 RepID=A0A2P4Q9X6_RHIID|nr:hypothetical protein GLOIN_2v1575812 [Rhizophagus irregularis DAOM 181602=DAOM 197198]POG74455.1 hypothetical protein GLOIN_2v1575812 [Rhizophagus irregularis DAOM 181602=DAOM 197198]|eukprot:XP_025181321.1 hypothetical protein GLOIN_2v1575812 [Rhizophagus irregularis DAOM 181602=DAOM 197198]